VQLQVPQAEEVLVEEVLAEEVLAEGCLGEGWCSIWGWCFGSWRAAQMY
jgi:hypothetical protein